MNEQKAKELVVEAGRRLVKEGLIARTWGNVSCRLNDTLFAITPSGRPYEKLTPAEIVALNLDDLSYEGDVEPSSEKRVHAAVYRQRREINFVIHTHQYYASAVSPLQDDIEVTGQKDIYLIGDRVVSIPYGLPGSKKLTRNVAATLARSKSKAYIMTAHGALCLGTDSAEAFRVAERLEQICADYILEEYRKVSGSDHASWPSLRNYYLSRLSGLKKDLSDQEPSLFCSSKRENNDLIMFTSGSSNNPFSSGKEIPIRIGVGRDLAAEKNEKLYPALSVHHAVYRLNPAVRAIMQVCSPNVLTFSRTGRKMYPMLDDFAQIVGADLPAVNIDPAHSPLLTPRQIAGVLKKRSAVILTGSGALCCGPSEDDALAAAAIMEKNALAAIITCLSGRGRPINPLETRLMRFIYLKKYARKATT